MQDDLTRLKTPLGGLEPETWREKLAEIADDLGYDQPLGDRHFAIFLDVGKTLLVTFENAASVRDGLKDGAPIGFGLVAEHGWSHLALFSEGDTWFRDARVFGYFDRLIDDGFFEDFDHVVFYGAGSAGYAAAAFSVAAPGATVIALQPQATLDPRVAEWDHRFKQMRRTSFTDRFGFAPDMLDAAKAAFVLYDPYEQLDVMHSVLYLKPNVTRLRTPHMPGDLELHVMRMGLLPQMLTEACSDRFSALSFYRAFRTRRRYRGYLHNLKDHLDARDQSFRTMVLCEWVDGRYRAPTFRRRLKALHAEMADGQFSAPGWWLKRTPKHQSTL